jgi:hypothetical protein
MAVQPVDARDTALLGIKVRAHLFDNLQMLLVFAFFAAVLLYIMYRCIAAISRDYKAYSSSRPLSLNDSAAVDQAFDDDVVAAELSQSQLRSYMPEGTRSYLDRLDKRFEKSNLVVSQVDAERGLAAGNDVVDARVLYEAHDDNNTVASAAARR